MSVYLSISNQWCIEPIQNSIIVPILNQFTTDSIQTLHLLPIILPILIHCTKIPIKTLLLLSIILPILNQWIFDPLQNYIIVPILDLLPTDPIKKFLLLPIIGLIGKHIKDHLLKFVFNHLLKYVFVPIKQHICYPFKCDSYVAKLRKQTQKLKKERDSLEQSVVEGDEVTKRLSNANDEIKEAEALILRIEEAKMKKWFFGLCPNLKGRYHLSEEADKKTSAIDMLLNQEGSDSISYPPHLQQIVQRLVQRSEYSHEGFPSSVSILNPVIDALKYPNSYRNLVHGLEGVGKTKLTNEVHGKAVEEKMFKRVVMVSVSQMPDLRKIQGEIDEVLGEKKTWSLFLMTVADANNLKLPDIAIKVAKKCSGLPILVNIVAADLKNKELSAWEDALVKLSYFDNEGTHGKVHKFLNSSCENLPSKQVKSLFLLCSLFGQSNIPTNHLLTYAMGLGLFKTIVGVKVARDRSCQRIEKLKTKSLLLDGDMNGHVKMHDVVLDFARSIATKDQHAFFDINGNGLRQLWRGHKMNCTRIAVHHHCDTSELPLGLQYPSMEDRLKAFLRGSGDLFSGEAKGMDNGLYDPNEEGFPKLKHSLDTFNARVLKKDVKKIAGSSSSHIPTATFSDVPLDSLERLSRLETSISAISTTIQQMNTNLNAYFQHVGFTPPHPSQN